MTGDYCVFNFLRICVDEKYLMRFQSENSVFKFLRDGFHGAFVFSVGLHHTWKRDFVARANFRKLVIALDVTCLKKIIKYQS